MNPIKQVMIDAVVGRGLLGVQDARDMEAMGYVKLPFLHTPSWAWNKEALGKLSTEELVDLYSRER